MSKKKPAEANLAAIKEELTIADVPCCGETTCLDCIVDKTPKAGATDNPLADAASTASAEPMAYTENLVSVYLVQEGDSYASIAKKLKPEGTSTHDFAQRLAAGNGNKTLLPGMVIEL